MEITCIKVAREKRKEGHYLAELADWNQRGMYTLTIDGGSVLTLDGNALGCLSFSGVDNVVVRNVRFEDYSNYVGHQIPDAVGAVSLPAVHHGTPGTFLSEDAPSTAGP